MIENLLHPSKGRLMEFVGEELGTTGQRKVAAHLAACERCRSEIESLSELRHALRHLPAAHPPTSIIDRALFDRAAGARTVLPTMDASPPDRMVPRRVVAGALGLAGVAAAVWLVVAVTSESEAPSRTPLLAFWPDAAFAQEPGRRAPTPLYSLVTRLDGTRLAPGRWVYRWDPPDIGRQVERVITVNQGQFGAQGAWLVVVETRGPYSHWQIDTAYLDAGDLRPFQRVARNRNERRLVYDFSRDSVRARYVNPMRQMDQRASAALPVPNSGAILPHWHGFRVSIGAIRLSRMWQGSFWQITGGTRPLHPVLSAYPMNLLVVGEESVSVAAGTFDCWQVVVQGGSSLPATLLWISKEHGWVVKSGYGHDYATPAEELVSYQVSR